MFICNIYIYIFTNVSLGLRLLGFGVHYCKHKHRHETKYRFWQVTNNYCNQYWSIFCRHMASLGQNDFRVILTSPKYKLPKQVDYQILSPKALLHDVLKLWNSSDSRNTCMRRKPDLHCFRKRLDTYSVPSQCLNHSQLNKKSHQRMKFNNNFVKIFAKKRSKLSFTEL